MEIPNPPRGAEYNEMLMDLLDDRPLLVDMLRTKAQKINVSLSGYTKEQLDLPTFLDLPRTMNLSSASIDVVAHKEKDAMVLDSITISPDDSAPIVLKDDEGLMLRQVGEDVSLLPSDALVKTLYSFFPPEVQFKLTIDKALQVIQQLSPVSDITYEFKDDKADFLSTIKVAESEKIDDSMFSIEIVKTVIHPSGSLLGTRMNMSESMKRHTEVRDSTDHGVTLDVEQNSSPVSQLFFESIDEQRSIIVTHPTRQHAEDILEVLDRLNQYGFNPPNSSAA